jgi:hypothetical protein
VEPNENIPPKKRPVRTWFTTQLIKQIMAGNPEI